MDLRKLQVIHQTLPLPSTRRVWEPNYPGGGHSNVTAVSDATVHLGPIGRGRVAMHS